jgi:hypothetical protein
MKCDPDHSRPSASGENPMPLRAAAGVPEPGDGRTRRRLLIEAATAARRRQLVESAAALAAKLGTRRITLREFCAQTGNHRSTVGLLFDGWGALCREAGLIEPNEMARVPDDLVYTAMRDAFLSAGGITTLNAFLRHFPYSSTVIRRRGWSWPGALAAFRRWAEVNAPDFPYFDRLAALAAKASAPAGGEAAPRPDAAASADAASLAIEHLLAVPDGELAPDPAPAVHPGSGRMRAERLLGEALNVPGLAHAPINEQGVIYAFGLIATRLGYAVETVAASFPDCEAKRHRRDGRWERVRIEFEYRSRGFREHGHDRRGCDVIVCWEHNWPECPLEVVELRQAFARIGAAANSGGQSA